MLLFFLVQLVFTQETTQKSYALYGKKLTEHITVHNQNRLEGTGEGIISVEHLDQKVEGELTEFSVIKNSKTEFQKNKLEKTYLNDRSIFVATMMGNSIKSVDSSYLEGKTISYTKEAYDLWNVSNFEEYKSYEQDELNDELVALNDSIIKVKTYFIYPERMRIGETLKLNKDNLGTFYEIKDYEAVSGTLQLKEVAKQNNDLIAIFEVAIQVKGIVDPEDNAFIVIEMNGIAKRSLTQFYDQEVSLAGTVTMKGKLNEDQFLTMFIPATLSMRQSIEN